jgi:hypothetical protein
MVTRAGITGKLAVQAALDDVRTEAEDKYDNLAQAYGELKLAWDNRGAREVDVQRINKLTQMIHERDEQIQGFEKKYSDLRNVRATRLMDSCGPVFIMNLCLRRLCLDCNLCFCCRKCCCARTTTTITSQMEALVNKYLVWTELCQVGKKFPLGCSRRVVLYNEPIRVHGQEAREVRE